MHPDAKIFNSEAHPETPEEIYYWEAFIRLNSSRASAFGVGLIPLSEIKAYCEFYNIKDLEERDDLLQIISALDSFYVSKLNEKSEVVKNGKS